MHIPRTAESAALQRRGARRRRTHAAPPLHHVLQAERVRALHLCAALGVRSSHRQGIALLLPRSAANTTSTLGAAQCCFPRAL